MPKEEKTEEIEAWKNAQLAIVAMELYESKTFIAENWEKARQRVFAIISEAGAKKMAVASESVGD